MPSIAMKVVFFYQWYISFSSGKKSISTIKWTYLFSYFRNTDPF